MSFKFAWLPIPTLMRVFRSHTPQKIKRSCWNNYLLIHS
jgi:hypothetical protein